MHQPAATRLQVMGTALGRRPMDFRVPDDPDELNQEDTEMLREYLHFVIEIGKLEGLREEELLPLLGEPSTICLPGEQPYGVFAAHNPANPTKVLVYTELLDSAIITLELLDGEVVRVTPGAKKRGP